MRIITGVVVRVASAVDVSGRRVVVALGVSARSAQFVPQPAVSERVLEVREGNDVYVKNGGRGVDIGTHRGASAAARHALRHQIEGEEEDLQQGESGNEIGDGPPTHT